MEHGVNLDWSGVNVFFHVINGENRGHVTMIHGYYKEYNVNNLGDGGIITHTYCYRSISNHKIKIQNGNISTTGIKIMTWNKGGAFLINRMDTIRGLIEDQKPLILALHEAQIPQSWKTILSTWMVCTRMEKQIEHAYTYQIVLLSQSKMT